MSYFDVDAYNTDRGWVGRAIRLDRFGQDELPFCSDLGFESETEEIALRRAIHWVLSSGGKIRKTPVADSAE